MARRRVGAGGAREIAAQPSLGSALALLADSVHAGRLVGCTTLADAQRATRETVLWQLRVLAGWLPAGGTRLLRAVAGGFERDNILALARRLDGHPTPADFELGALATAWPRLRTASSVEDLLAAVRRSAWGDPGAEGITTLPDVLTLVWLRTVARAAPEARRWTAAAGALTVGRSLLVERVVPSVRHHVGAVILAEADAVHATLIVMARVSRPGHALPYVGSQTLRVLEFAAVPVLVVPTGPR